MFANETIETLIVKVAVLAVMLLVAFPIHEFAHALAAFRLGDSTARLFGRLTLNPQAHIDPAGALMLAVSMLALGVGFGWAKPTPVNPMNLRGGRWGEAIVAAAGPISNFVLAIAGALPLRYMIAADMDLPWLQLFLLLFVEINLLLMVFNFIPIPPLDGSKVLFAFLDPRTAWQVRPTLEQYGPIVFFALIALPLFGGPNIFGLILNEVMGPLLNLLIGFPLL